MLQPSLGKLRERYSPVSRVDVATPDDVCRRQRQHALRLDLGPEGSSADRPPSAVQTTYTISADSVSSARQIAEARGRAEGFRTVNIFTVRPTGPHTYEVEAYCTR